MTAQTAALKTAEGDVLTLTYGDPVLDGGIAVQVESVEGHVADAHLTPEEVQALAAVLSAVVFQVVFADTPGPVPVTLPEAPQ